jgi:hypothetical protein
VSIELIIGILTLFGSAALGLPVAFAILVGVLVYLGVAGQDLAIAGETMVQRLFDGFLLLAVPLFIVSGKYYECRINFRPIVEFLCRGCWSVSWRFGPCQCCDKPDLFGNVWLGRR